VGLDFEARYRRDPSRVGAQVHYVAHREEVVADGRRCGLYGIGERYCVMKGDEAAIRKADGSTLSLVFRGRRIERDVSGGVGEEDYRLSRNA
jgi:hypothetical protein